MEVEAVGYNKGSTTVVGGGIDYGQIDGMATKLSGVLLGNLDFRVMRKGGLSQRLSQLAFASGQVTNGRVGRTVGGVFLTAIFYF